MCFRRRFVLDQSLTFNFGARVSGFYWNRVAGLLIRLSVARAQIYVDDLLTLLLRSSAPLLTALLVIMLSVLRIPMSKRKAALSLGRAVV